jgi:uncharacterized damage-inducible protein DinB
MISPAYLLQLYEYHYWANRQFMDTAAGLNSEQLFQPQGHSWGSLFGVLLHMTHAEWIWLMRWKGISPAALPAQDQFPDLSSVRTRWNGLETEIMDFIRSLNSARLQQEIAYTNTSGNYYRLPLWQLMVHVPNHATHHRGELAAMFALMDIPHPEDDWLYYFLSTTGQRDL